MNDWLLLGLNLLAKIAKLFARHQILFNVLKSDSFGLRDQKKSYHDKDQVEAGIQPERSCRPNTTQK